MLALGSNAKSVAAGIWGKRLQPESLLPINLTLCSEVPRLSTETKDYCISF
jgi:hypothetical protein